MTATFAADVTLRAAQERLARNDQWLAIDGDPDAALGHLMERNSTGPLRLGFGAWRDLALGVQFVNGRGRLVTAGGRTVKNVAGYDLTKFLVGQRGIFGKIVTLTTRTYRRPAAAVLATLPPDVSIVPKLLISERRPQWIILTRDALFLGYLGDDQAIAHYERAVRQAMHVVPLKRSLDDDMAHRRQLWSDAAVRATVPPARLAEFVQRAGVDDFAADAAFGIITIRNLSDRAIEVARSVGGDVVGDRVADPVEMQVLQRLKSALDPENRLGVLKVAD